VIRHIITGGLAQFERAGCSLLVVVRSPDARPTTCAPSLMLRFASTLRCRANGYARAMSQSATRLRRATPSGSRAAGTATAARRNVQPVEVAGGEGLLSANSGRTPAAPKAVAQQCFRPVAAVDCEKLNGGSAAIAGRPKHVDLRRPAADLRHSHGRNRPAIDHILRTGD
jgi:hypothetical protein